MTVDIPGPLQCIPSLAKCKLGRKQIENSSAQVFEFFLGVQTLCHLAVIYTKKHKESSNNQQCRSKSNTQQCICTLRYKVRRVPLGICFDGSVSSRMVQELEFASPSQTYCLSDLGLFVETSTLQRETTLGQCEQPKTENTNSINVEEHQYSL